MPQRCGVKVTQTCVDAEPLEKYFIRSCPQGHCLLSGRRQCPQGHFSNGSIFSTFSPETSPCGIYSRHLISPVKWDFCLNMKRNVLKNKLMEISVERGTFPCNKKRETNKNELKTQFSRRSVQVAPLGCSRTVKDA